MPSVKQIYDFMDYIAPFRTAMDFDNCGLLVGDMNNSVDKILFSLDITSEVVEEAVKEGANLIISHHPVIFSPIKKLDFSSPISLLIKNNINAICAHTNLDMSSKCGVNLALAHKLDLKNLESLSCYSTQFYDKITVFVPFGYEEVVTNAMHDAGAGSLGNYSRCSFLSRGKGSFLPSSNSTPFIGTQNVYQTTDESKIEVICPSDKTDYVLKKMREVHPYEEPAFDVFEDKGIKTETVCGFIGELENPMKDEEFALFVKNKLSCKGLRYTKLQKNVKKVAVCSGGGGEYIACAINKGVDAFVTGEIKHHQILQANSAGIMVVDAGHFRTEDVVFARLIETFKSKFPNLSLTHSKVFCDNIEYIGTRLQ